jgi:hypothetical protein
MRCREFATRINDGTVQRGRLSATLAFNSDALVRFTTGFAMRLAIRVSTIC